MKNIPQSVVKELEKLKAIDEAPYIFLTDKIEFCTVLYSANFRELKRWNVFGIMERQPELIDYRYLTENQIDFIREQYTYALESI